MLATFILAFSTVLFMCFRGRGRSEKRGRDFFAVYKCETQEKDKTRKIESISNLINSKQVILG